MTPLLLFTAALLPQGPAFLSHSAVVSEAGEPCRGELRTSLIPEHYYITDGSGGMRQDDQPGTLTLDLDEAALRHPPTSANRHPLRQDSEMARPSSGGYLELDLGLSMMSGYTSSFLSESQTFDFDPAVVIGGAFCYRVFHHWRGEVNYNHRQAGVDKVNGVSSAGDGTLTMLMVNFYYDFALASRWSPYVGAGMGTATYEIETPTIDASDTSAFAFGLMAGVAYRLTNELDLSVGYRYETVAGVLDADLDLNEVVVGVRYSF